MRICSERVLNRYGIMKSEKPAVRRFPFEKNDTVRIGGGKNRIPSMGTLEDFNGIAVEADFTVSVTEGCCDEKRDHS